jgi:hypothetical protein
VRHNAGTNFNGSTFKNETMKKILALIVVGVAIRYFLSSEKGRQLKNRVRELLDEGLEALNEKLETAAGKVEDAAAKVDNVVRKGAY